MERALFLDLDGTLADSLVALRQTYEAFVERYGSYGSDEEFDHLNGLTVPEIVRHVRETHDLPNGQDSLLREYRSMISANHQSSPPVAGAADLMWRARERGYLVCIVTSSSRDLLDGWLQRHGLDAVVDFSVTSSDVVAGKPQPDLYLRALELTGCSTADSLAIEDSANGVLAATRAGLTTWRLCLSGPLPAGPERGQLATLGEAEALLST